MRAPVLSDAPAPARALGVLYLHQHYSGPGGATATRAHAHASVLAARGHDVTLACGSYEGADTGLGGLPFGPGGSRAGPVAGGFGVVEYAVPCANAMRARARSRAFLAYARRATGLALSRRWDVVLASSTPLTVALPALAARALRGTPFVFEIRDPWPELPAAMRVAPAPVLWGMGRLADAACGRASAVVALTEGVAEAAVARGADPARVRVVPQGCDLDLFGPRATPWRPPEAAPWELLATYAGAQGRANGLDLLLDAARALLDAPPSRPVRLLLVGDGSERERLRERAAREGLSNVTFLDPVPKARLAGLFAESGAVLHLLADVPAFAEWTAPNKVMDGLAAGRPVVTNAPGRTARIVSDGPSGIAVPPGDPPALAAAIRSLADDPVRRAAMGAAARAQAERLWDRRVHARALCEVVEEAAASPLRRRRHRPLAPPEVATGTAEPRGAAA